MTVQAMAFDEVMAALGILAPPEEWRGGWAAALESCPAEVPFLTDAFLDEVQAVCGYAEEIVAALRDAQRAVRADPRLTRLAWLCHREAFRAATEPAAWGWPNPIPLFTAVVVLSGLPLIIARNRANGIPDAVTRATCRDLELWMRHDRLPNGTWAFSRLGWMMHHIHGRLHRLGRLQFVHQPFTGRVAVYRHRATGTVTTLSTAGVVYRRDGLVNGTNGRSEDDAWTATLAETADAVTGHPIAPRGFADPTPVTLNLAEWVPVLAKGDPTLDLHIPQDGPMDHQHCGEALRQALAFYPRYYPALPAPRAFTCYTWLLDPQYSDLLPPTSNIVRFQREFRCFPLPSDDLDPFFRVFGGKPADLHAAPRDTTLRRAMLDHTLAGGAFRQAGGFILIDGLDWGGAGAW
jgi:hypothetical protein